MPESFAAFEEEFLQRTGEIIWCTATTVDARGRPRSRILHPIWEVVDGVPVGWVVTSRTPVKSAHVDANPHLACMYWNPAHHTVSIDCIAGWADDAGRQRAWNLFMSTPPPLGYDLSWFGDARWDHPLFNPLRLEAWRVQMLRGEQVAAQDFVPRTWRA
jgi:uncharacterized protein YbdZ (MbtH family)